MDDPRYAPFLGAKWACEDCGVAVTNQATHTRFHSILSAHAWALAVLKNVHLAAHIHDKYDAVERINSKQFDSWSADALAEALARADAAAVADDEAGTPTVWDNAWREGHAKGLEHALGISYREAFQRTTAMLRGEPLDATGMEGVTTSRTLGPGESAPWRDPGWIDQEQYPCEGCGAPPGTRCRTPNGNQSAIPHVSRWRQSKDAERTATIPNRQETP